MTRDNDAVFDKMVEDARKDIADWRKRIDKWDEWVVEKDRRDDANQKALDYLIQRKDAVPLNLDGGIENKLSYAITENFGGIKSVSGRHAHSFQIKAGTMTGAVSLTGSPITSYLPGSIKSPSAGQNFRDLCQVIATESGYINLPVETGSSGSVSRVPENTAKPQLDYQILMKQFKASYIAGFVRISKELLQDLSFLQTWLPRMLLRDFYKSENAQLYADLAAVATGTPGAAGANYAETLINHIAALGGAGYVPNGIVSTYANWSELMKTKGVTDGAYGAPGIIVTDSSGASRIAGIPFYPTSWVAAGKTIVADWGQIVLAVCDPLKIEFFEQDQDNVTKNLVTVRIEAREVLVIEQTDAVIHA